MQGVFITGTSTEVGKTFVAAEIARQLKQKNIRVIPRKPVESGCTRQGKQLVPQDAAALKQAADYQGDLADVCPYRFEPAISPARAAQLANQVLTTEQLVQICQPGNDGDFLMVEGAGGFYSPLTENGLNADLATALQLPVLLVADDKLGTINQVLLNAEAIQQRGLWLLAVVLNSLSDSRHADMDNLADLRDRLECPVYSSPWIKDGSASLPQQLIMSLAESCSRMPGYFQPVYKRWELPD